tara:strand:+ start:268 stop:471 length:204 start_codon:yes stop_codon:yes gene_type:complete
MDYLRQPEKEVIMGTKKGQGQVRKNRRRALKKLKKKGLFENWVSEMYRTTAGSIQAEAALKRLIRKK